MYTVNNTNFFDFGVDAGDAQLDVWDKFIRLSTPIQFFETPQSELFVSHLPAHSHLHARARLLHTYIMNTFLCTVPFSSHDIEYSKLSKILQIFSSLSKLGQHILTFINKFVSFCFKIEADA